MNKPTWNDLDPRATFAESAVIQFNKAWWIVFPNKESLGPYFSKEQAFDMLQKLSVVK